jgi:FeS assembly protein IscX
VNLETQSRLLRKAGGLTSRTKTKMKLTWNDAEDIGLALQEKFPTIDPLSVRFTDLHKYVIELDGFIDDAKGSNESKLEAIQMAWYEEWKANQ